ncbi:MAG: (4Fe-4S)-binding protein [Desulfitobacterium sp.]
MGKDKATTLGSDGANNTRVYRTDDLIVYWDARQCSHAGKCWRNLPQVFRPDERPWVNLASATPEEIIATVDKCPTDALKYELPEGSKVNPEIAQGMGSINYKKLETTSIKVKMTRSGPLRVEGLAQVFDADGELIKQSHRIILCGCGKSGNRPFCDGSHASQS